MPNENMEKLLEKVNEELLASMIEGIDELSLEQLLRLQVAVNSKVEVS